MSTFRQQTTQQPSAPPPAQAAKPPFAAPGVVPPPATPTYTTRPPELPRRTDAAELVAEKVRTARGGDVQEKVRIAVQRAGAPVAAAADSATRPVRQVLPGCGDRPAYNPVSYAQTGMLNLAWRWQQAGAPIRAIHTYIELLQRYPNTPAADAAVADRVDLSEKLAQDGQFHTALAIYDHLEYLA